MSTGSRFASEARRARWWARSSRVGSPTDHPPLAVPLNGATEVVFPSPKGALRDPHNTSSNLRRALDAAGFPWVTSHVFRKAVATLMDHAGLSSGPAVIGHAGLLGAGSPVGRFAAEAGRVVGVALTVVDGDGGVEAQRPGPDGLTVLAHQ
jgi:hypothetical protein